MIETIIVILFVVFGVTPCCMGMNSYRDAAKISTVVWAVISVVAITGLVLIIAINAVFFDGPTIYETFLKIIK